MCFCNTTLRITFTSVEGKPIQVVAPVLYLTLDQLDIRDVPEFKRESEMQRLGIQETRRPFNLKQGPLVRATLFQLAEQEHVLLLNMHHIISDGWSVGVFLHELAVLYSTHSRGMFSSLPGLPIQYADFAVWQHQWLQGAVLEKQLTYWKQHLEGVSPLLQLPYDRPRPAIQSFQGASHTFVLSQLLTDALRVLSRRQGVTLFITLLAAFQTLLYRYTGQNDIVMGTPIANRMHSQTESLIGFFVNMLVLRVDLGGNPTFQEVLVRVREVALEAYAHQDVPFEKLVEELQPERDLSYNPLFQVLFLLQKALTEDIEIPELSLEVLEIHNGMAQFDLTLEFTETPEILSGRIEYNTALFEAATIERMAGHMQTLLEGIVAHPEHRLGDLPLLSEQEHGQLLVEWNDTKVNYPELQCIHQLFGVQVERTPDSIAVVSESQQLTYHELNQRANKLAHYLRAMGVGPEVLVGICVERSVEMVVGVLGILKAGGAYVPLDPIYPRERLAFMLQDAQVQVLLTQQRLVERLPEHQAQVVCLDADWEKVAHESPLNPVSGVEPDHLAYVIYTSGSTGHPKGTLITHCGLYNLAMVQLHTLDVSASKRVLQFASLSFDASIWEISMTLLVGATLCLGVQDSILAGSTLVALLQQQAITTVTLPPSVLAVLSDEELPALQSIISAGEACSAEIIARWGRDRHFFNAYGPTEATVCTTITKCTNGNHWSSIGRPIANTQVYILDGHLQPVPIGVAGELHIGGAGLARGYLNRPELTAERFIPNPFNNMQGTRLYKTGDLVRYLPDGNIEFLGRIDQQVKIRGFRIELGEIKAVLSQHPAVQECIVVVREDTSGQKSLAAYFINNQPSVPSLRELRSFLQEHLPDYMIPTTFTVLDALPLTPNGKVDHLRLPTLDQTQSNLESTFVEPRNILELQLVRIWEEILDTSPIGVKNNFFELGGHSLQAIRIITRVQRLLGRSFPLSLLFKEGTIERLAYVLSKQGEFEPWSPLVRLQSGGSKPPVFGVHGLSGHVMFYVDLARHLGFDQPFYGLQAPGFDGEQEPYTRLEDIAALYIEALRTIQPEGPYFLGGHSGVGGAIAFEMAQQFRKQSQKVALLVLLDSSAEVYNRSELLDDATYWSWRHGPYLPSLSINHLRLLEPEEQLNCVVDLLNQSDTTHPLYKGPNIRSLLKVQKSIVQAIVRHTPQVYPGRVVLFKTGQQTEEHVNDPEMGWRRIITGDIDVYDVPGTHSTFFKAPHVEVVAEQLRESILTAYSETR